MVRKLPVFLFIFTLALLLIACSGGESSTEVSSEANDADAATENTEEENTEENANAEAEADVRIVEVSTPPTSKNLSWQTPEGEILGYEPDVLRAIEEKLDGYKFNFQAVTDSAQETGLKTGKYDIAIGGYYRNEEREEQFIIPEEPTGLSLIKIYVHKDSDINELKDLVGKKIVPPTAGGGIFNFLTKWNEENPDYQIEFEGSSGDIPYPERLKSIVAGQFDALVLPSNLGQNEVIEELNLDIKESDPVAINKTYILIHKSEENEKLAEDINRALKELREDGTLSEISMKYYGEDIFQYDE